MKIITKLSIGELNYIVNKDQYKKEIIDNYRRFDPILKDLNLNNGLSHEIIALSLTRTRNGMNFLANHLSFFKDLPVRIANKLLHAGYYKHVHQNMWSFKQRSHNKILYRIQKNNRKRYMS